MLFVRREAGRITAPNWLDGAIAGCGAAAVCAAFAFASILHLSGQSMAATLTNLAYPLGDVLLLGLVVGGFAVLSHRSRAPWVLLATGMALNVVGDTSNLFPDSFGASRPGFILNAVAWPTAIVLMSLAVWLPRRASDPLLPERPAGFLLPNLFSAAALVVLVVAGFHQVSRLAIALATATLLIVGVRLALSVRQIRRESEERHRQSLTDDLTGLYNRRYMFRVLDAFFDDDAAESGERTLAFLFVDLDRFKEINDSFGHPAGDELLRQLGARLSASVRDTDLLVRFGGDEFAVVLVDGDAEYATSVAERVTAALAEPFTLDVVKASISASIGIAVAPADATDSAGLVWCADVAMYRSKLGNTPFAPYRQDLDEDGDQMRLLDELRSAIEDGGQVLHYQPQLDLHSSEIVAVEALVRWTHPRMGLLAPDKFIPLAEQGGLMPALTRWVLAEAATQCAAWRTGGSPVTVSVNVSPSNLLEPDFVGMVQSHLDRHSLPADSLVLEITEASVIAEFDRAQRVIGELRDRGLTVSIDDFGAGATSLAYLSNLAVGELKLDRSFIMGLAGDGARRDIDLVRSTIELGHAMGLRIVAEGIEDTPTLELLTEMGCDLAQGYCISRPKPAGDLAFRLSAGAASAIGR
jgi:diguanylate cyclase (GGDEF)-like protein